MQARMKMRANDQARAERRTAFALATTLCLLITSISTAIGASEDTNAPAAVDGQATVSPMLRINEPILSVETSKPYQITENDLVEVRVYQQDDLTTRSRIGPDGTITIPLLGAVSIKGKTVEEASSHIRGLLAKDYLVNPQVAVTIEEHAQRLFTVLGEVNRPGTYEMPRGQPLTLLQAIAMGGGFTRIGAPGSVSIIREVGGQRKVFKIDAGAMAKNPKARPFEVLPFDTVMVGERLF